MTPSSDELISAALDGERVDVTVLRQALATGDGRQTLAAYVLLRAAAVSDDLEPGELVTRTLEQAMARPSHSWPRAARVPATLAASFALVAMALSFWLGTTVRMPQTTLVVMAPASSLPTAGTPGGFVPGTTTVPFTTGSTVTGGIPPAREVWLVPRRIEVPPTPTKTLRFVPGVDWHPAGE